MAAPISRPRVSDGAVFSRSAIPSTARGGSQCMASPPTISVSISGVNITTGPIRVSPSSICSASSKLSARNRIQPRQTMWKVTSTPTTVGMTFFSLTAARNSRSIT